MSTIEIAISENGANFAFQRIKDNFRLVLKPGQWLKLGPLRLRLSEGRAHLEEGKFRIIQSAGTYKAQVKELDLVWDRLRIDVGLNIQKVCIGDFCLVPAPWGCAVKIPGQCFFGDDPDIYGTLPLDRLRHEISSAFIFHVTQDQNSWELILKPAMPIDIDLIDPEGIIGEIFDNFIKELVRALLNFLPDWAVAIIEAILGSFAKLVRTLLDLGDDLLEWISEKIGLSLGLLNIIASIILEFFYDGEPIQRFENPYTILKADRDKEGNILPAVKVPLDNVSVKIKSDRIEVAVALGA